MGDNHEERIRDVEINLAMLGENVIHIKEQIDNHVLSMLRDINEKVVEISPQVRTNSWWITKIKWGVFLIAFIGVGSGLAKYLFWG